MERSSATSAAESVRLVVTLTETGGTLYKKRVVRKYSTLASKYSNVVHENFRQVMVEQHACVVAETVITQFEYSVNRNNNRTCHEQKLINEYKTTEY